MIKKNQGITYYVSPNGNDNNNGQSPEQAWKTIQNVTADAGILKAGDKVLFERKGIYRGSIKAATGVTYSAYGQGYKPRLYGSLKNYAVPEIWKQTSNPSIWALEVGNMSDIGNVVFDHGLAWTMKRLEPDIKEDFDIYHNREEGILYLYFKDGNPATVYNDIEVCSNDHIIWGGQHMHDITIDNLCIKYCGAHGICFAHDSKNITVRNCEIGYIGGSMLDETVRYGNGFEVVDGCCDILVENNWVYQCYDAGITHQSSNPAGCVQKRITFRRNLVEACNYNIEYYVDTKNSLIEDTIYEENVLKNAGYGFGSRNRIGSNTSVLSHICCYCRNIPGKNFVIKNNILDTSLRNLTAIGCTNNCEGMGPIMTDNIYIQNQVANQDTEVVVQWSKELGREEFLKANTQEEMEKAIAQIDSRPKLVVFRGE